MGLKATDLDPEAEASALGVSLEAYLQVLLKFIFLGKGLLNKLSVIFTCPFKIQKKN